MIRMIAMREGQERGGHGSVKQDGSHRRPWVIAVGAVSGGGKTTIAKGLAERMAASRVLLFDDYDFEGPDNLPAWVDQGADYQAWDLTPLVADLKRALSEPWQHILLDYPFAYSQDQVRPYIDVAIFVDTPLDVALSRRLLRDFRGSSGEAILRDVQHYVESGRPAYLEQLTTVRHRSDIVVDGIVPPAAIVTDILVQLAPRLTTS